MKACLRFVLIFFCLIVVPAEGISQRISPGLARNLRGYAANNEKKNKITMQFLKSATEIIYGFNNGSVAPDYAYQGYIVVTPKTVTLDIYHRSSKCYSETETISSSEYSKFLNQLVALGIKDNPEDPLMLDGAGVFDIVIKKNGKILFKGAEDEDIVTTKGHLRDPFVSILSPSQKSIYDNPENAFAIDTEFYLDDIDF